MAQQERNDLPDRCFAYVDAHGRRRLPIHDEAHVRNALARFNQVAFEDEAARERARARLLHAAKRFRIVPVGFIAGQLRSERASDVPRARSPGVAKRVRHPADDRHRGLDRLLHELGDGYGESLEAVREVLRTQAEEAGGVVVETRADEFFAAYESPIAARRRRPWPCSAPCAPALAARDRRCGSGWGLHSGYPTVTVDNYLGMAVHTAARVCAAAHGGQIVVTADTRLAVQSTREGGVRFRGLGTYQLRGIPAPVGLFQVGAKGLPTRFPPLRATPVPLTVRLAPGWRQPTEEPLAPASEVDADVGVVAGLVLEDVLVGVPVDQLAVEHRVEHAADLVLDRGEHLAAVEVDDVLEAVLAVVGLHRDQPALGQRRVGLGEVGEVHRDVVAVVVGERPVGLHEPQALRPARPAPRRRRLPSTSVTGAGAPMTSR